MMPIPKLPKKPVHLFTVKWWEMTWTGYTYYLTPCEATYHVFTPWRTFSPEGPAGLDLDHEWMISRNGRPECRMWGWASGLKDAMWEDRYLSKEEAAKAALKCAHVSQEVLENRLHDVRENIIELEKIAMTDTNLGIIHCDTARGLTIFHGTLAEAGFSNEEATLLIRLINGTIAEAASKGKGYAKIAYPEGEKREALESAIMHQGYWLSSCEKILTIHWAGGYDEDENDFEIG